MEESFKDHIYVLILCGGGGTRLWPRSREKTPKQFLKNFFGEGSIFSQTVQRAQWLTSNEKIFVITNKDYIDEVVDQGKVISPRNIIVEPQKKNTAMAVGVGAAYIKKIDPKAVIINFASDHVVGDKDVFIKEMLLAAEEAFKGENLLAVGLKPTFAHTGYGYIQYSDKIYPEKEIFKVVSFKEKPDMETAERFVKDGHYLWNGSFYIWSASAIWKSFSEKAPQIFELIEKVFNALGLSNEESVLTESYEKTEEISVDYAISEKSSNMLLVPGTFSWNDIGDWKVAYDLKEKDDNENVVEIFGKNGWHLGIDTKNCLVEADNMLVATVGVENLVIIQTENAFLVVRKDLAQDVKKVVTVLKEKGKKEYL